MENDLKGGRVRSRLNILLAEMEVKSGRTIRQAELAEKTGIRPTTISHWMKQKPIEKIDSSVLERLCEFFDCEIGDLLFIDKKKP